tara:strand:+ start:17 stop:220 length:204 start_codon:yes stop_codon:yes gene_type:complete
MTYSNASLIVVVQTPLLVLLELLWLNRGKNHKGLRWLRLKPLVLVGEVQVVLEVVQAVQEQGEVVVL